MLFHHQVLSQHHDFPLSIFGSAANKFQAWKAHMELNNLCVTETTSNLEIKTYNKLFKHEFIFILCMKRVVCKDVQHPLSERKHFISPDWLEIFSIPTNFSEKNVGIPKFETCASPYFTHINHNFLTKFNLRKINHSHFLIFLTWYDVEICVLLQAISDLSFKFRTAQRSCNFTSTYVLCKQYDLYCKKLYVWIFTWCN